MAKAITNMGASVRDRLKIISREKNRRFDFLLTQFVHERILYRLSKSGHADNFVLKGGMLLVNWVEDRYRPTKDLDLLGFGDPDQGRLLNLFRDALAMDVNDGIAFDLETLHAAPIRDDIEYGGIRLRTTASITRSRIQVVIDVGFGDATEPKPEIIDYPTLLDFPAPRMRAYTKETVIAEKFHAMVTLGLINSRLKDYYDVWILIECFAFDDSRLALAIASTFSKRDTSVPKTLPDGLSPRFYEDEIKQHMWATLPQQRGHDTDPLVDVVKGIGEFIMPHAIKAAAIQRGENGV